MGNSLQEQLLKAGLVSEDQLEKSRQPAARPKRRKGGDKRKKSQAGRGAKPTKPAAPASTPVEELNRQIRVLLDEHRQNDDTGEVPFYFQREGRIKKLFVTEEQRRRLVAGEFAVAGYRRRHHVIPLEVADQIQSLREEIFVFRSDPNAPVEADPSAEDDVPDDLVW
ncbi:MAG: DUF2058 domain-containing protein [Gammaproteobacteria bacterium]|nr:DUF2058 domain-containing protein [Gammaproteobacteria bacterium]